MDDTKSGEWGEMVSFVLENLGVSDVKELKGLTVAELQDMGVIKGLSEAFGGAKTFQFRKKCLPQLLQGVDEDKSQKGDTFSRGVKPPPSNVHRANRKGGKVHIGLLFYGETGVGKSTLLKSLTDFVNGVPYENVGATERVAEMGASQTQDSRQFNVNNTQWDIDITDTPGIGDTRGTAVDAHNMNTILQKVGEIGEFNAVCILLKRGETRLHARLEYIVNELRAHMPRDVQDNFIIILTRSELPIVDADTEAVLTRLNLPVDNIIAVNNLAYEQLSANVSGNALIQANMIRKDAYYKNHVFLEMILQRAATLKPYCGDKIMQLKLKRDHLKEEVGLLRRKIEAGFKTEKEMHEKTALLQQMEHNTKNFAQNLNRVIEETIYTWEKVSGKITTNCNVCNKACHIDCGLSYGDNLTSCCCANGNTCGVCGHLMSSHCHLGWRGIAHTTKKTVEDAEMRRMLTDETQRKKMVENEKTRLKSTLQQIESERHDMTRRIQELYRELESIALIGYNESYEKYMLECKKAVENDVHLTPDEKTKRISVFDEGINLFKTMVSAITNRF